MFFHIPDGVKLYNILITNHFVLIKSPVRINLSGVPQGLLTIDMYQSDLYIKKIGLKLRNCWTTKIIFEDVDPDNVVEYIPEN